MFNKEEIGITKFQCCNKDFTDLLKVQCMQKRRKSLELRYMIATSMYTRSFCEFLAEPK